MVRSVACRELGITPQFRVYSGPKPVQMVVSLNLHRRHLNESQRGMVAAKVATLKHGQKPGDVEISTSTQTEAADLLNVSRETVIKARKVIEKGTPALREAVERGAVKAPIPSAA